MVSHARLSSISAPSTACSASTECGGTRISSTAALSRARRGPTTATLDSGSATSDVGLKPDLFLGDDRHRQIDSDVGVQVQLHDVLAGLADRAVRQTHFRALDFEARLASRLGDVRGADRAEQLAFASRLRGERQLEALQLRCA